MTTKQYLRSLERAAKRYAKLKIWGRDLSHIGFTIYYNPKNWASSGEAWVETTPRSYWVIAGKDVADAHETILHELAHTALHKNENHGPVFTELLSRAVSEAVGAWVDPPPDPYRWRGNTHIRALRRKLDRKYHL
jgi:hypothetical protein